MIPDQREIWIKVLSNLKRDHRDYWINFLDYIHAVMSMSPEIKEEYALFKQKIRDIEEEYGATINEIISLYYIYEYEALKISPRILSNKDGFVQYSTAYKQIGKSVFEKGMLNIKSWFFRDILKKLKIRYTDTSLIRPSAS